MTDHTEMSEHADAAAGDSTMLAVVQTAYGRPQDVLELASIERPRPGPDDVLVRVRAASVNTPDWIFTIGEPYVLRLQAGFRGPKTPVRGTDLAGTVADVGANVTDLSPGDEVFGSGIANTASNPSGSFAEFATAPSSHVIRKPASLSFEDAAASVMSGITALGAMRDAATIEPGMKVLVNGASGGVGTFAVQIAKSMGAEVTGVCSGANAELVGSLGADRVIDYTKDDFTEMDERYDVILDNVLNHRPSHAMRALAPGGIYLPNSVGQGSAWFAGLPRIAGAMLRGLFGIRVGTVRCDVNHDNLRELTSLIESGVVKPVVGSTYTLEETPQAVDHMLGHHAVGNIVITV